MTRQLPFLDGGTEHGPIRDFWYIPQHKIPLQPGVYILMARNFTFPYPRSRSSVFYIGQTSNLKRRLGDHLRFATQARDDRQAPLYWPMYEYAAAFGGRYATILTKPH